MRTIDVRHLGRERVIAAYLVDGCLVDCGPTASLDGLLAGLGDERPSRLLLTHIHLDHAGGAGSLVQRWPDLEVWVHERGAPHLVDPSKLLASAGRLYGDQMDRLWGDVVPVPARNLRILSGGERIAGWHVAYTPGHASHHVSYLHTGTGTAFVGDTGGVRIPPGGPTMPPTPPPDIDPAAWQASLDTIEQWDPSALAITHFGTWTDVGHQIAELREALDRAVAWARETPETDAYAERDRAYLRERTDEATAAVYEQGMPPEQLFPGIERALSRVASTRGNDA